MNNVHVFENIGYGCKVKDNIVLSNLLPNYKPFSDSHIGAYVPYLVRDDAAKKYEIGVGKLDQNNNQYIIIRQKIISSSNGLDPIQSDSCKFFIFANEYNFNTAFNNVSIKNTNFIVDNVRATYIVDTTSGPLSAQLPDPSANPSLIVDFKIINNTLGRLDLFCNNNLIYTIKGINKYITLASTGNDWVVLQDHVSDTKVQSLSSDVPFSIQSDPGGNDGELQYKFDNTSFSGANMYFGTNDKLLFGSSSEVSAKNVIPTTGDYNIEFNQTKDSGNFTIYGTGEYQNFTFTHDGSIGVNLPSGIDAPSSGNMVVYGEEFTTASLTGNYNLFFAYDGRLGLNIPSTLPGPQTLVHFINWDCAQSLKIENRTTCHNANVTLLHRPPTINIPNDTEIGTISFSSKNSDGNETEYARLSSTVVNYIAGNDLRGKFDLYIASGNDLIQTLSSTADKLTSTIGQSILQLTPARIGLSSENIIFSGNDISFVSLNGTSGTINAANINVGNTLSVNNLELSNLANTSILTISNGSVEAASINNPISIIGAPSGKLLRTDADGRIFTDISVGDFFRTNNDIVYSAYPHRLAEGCLSQIIFDADDQPDIEEYSIGDQISITRSNGVVEYNTITNMTVNNNTITVLFTQNQITPSTESGLLIQSISKGFLLILQKYVDPDVTSVNDATSTVLSTRPDTPTVFNTAQKPIQFTVYTDSDLPGLDIRPSVIRGNFVTDGTYKLYSTHSNTLPLQVAISVNGVGASNEFNTANYNYASELRWSGLLSDVGTNGLPSYYGTYDQNGNVAEWIANNTDEHRNSDTFYIAGGSITSTGVPFNAFEELVGSGVGSGVGFRLASAYGLQDSSYISGILGIQFNTIGNPKNIASSDGIIVNNNGEYSNVSIDNLGRVNYQFRLSKHEVTNNQYAAFLNVVATGSDNLGLYNDLMYSDDTGGIEQVGSGPLSYVVKGNYGDKPVNFVTYLNAIRFSNWLHNGAPTGLTESFDNITESGAYNISQSNGAVYSIRKNTISNYYIPDIHEWYKSAYFEPGEIQDSTSNTVLINTDTPYESGILTVGGNTHIEGFLSVSGNISAQDLNVTSAEGNSIISTTNDADDVVSILQENVNSLALVNSVNGRLTIGPNPVYTIDSGSDLDGAYRTGFDPNKVTIAADGPIKLISPEPIIVSGIKAKKILVSDLQVSDDEGNIKDFFQGPSGAFIYKISSSEASSSEQFKFIPEEEEIYLSQPDNSGIIGLSPLYTNNTHYLKSYNDIMFNEDHALVKTLLKIQNKDGLQIGDDEPNLKGALLVHQGVGPLAFEINSYLEADGLTYNRYPKRVIWYDSVNKRIEFVAPPAGLGGVAKTLPTQEELDEEYNFGDTVAIMHTGNFEVEYVKLAARLMGPFDGPDALYITHPPIFNQDPGDDSFYTYSCPKIKPNEDDGGEELVGFTGIMYSITKSSILTNGLGYGMFSQDPVATSGFDCVLDDPVPNTPDATFTFRPSSKYVLSTRPLTHTHFNAVGENIDFAIYGRTKFEYTRYYPEIFDPNPNDGDLPAGLIPVFRIDANVPNAVSGSVTGIFYSGYVDQNDTIPTGFDFDQIGKACINTNSPYVITSINKSTSIEPEGYATLDFVADLSVNGYTYSSGIITDHIYLSGMHGTEYTPGAALTVDVNGKIISINPDVPPGPPGPPRNVQAIAGNASANLNWLMPVDIGGSPIIDYKIQYSTNNGAIWTDVVDTASNITNQQVTDLVNQANYIFRIAAINQIGIGQWSLPSNQVTPSSIFPGSVRSMTLERSEVASTGVDRITVTWIAPLSSGSSEITRYVVRYKKTIDNTFIEKFVAADSAVNDIFTSIINGIDPGPQYTIQVSAENNFGEGVPVSQNILGTDEPPPTPPAPPDPYDFGLLTFNGLCST